MPLDSIFISALTSELSGALADAKIEKVQQPGRGSIILQMRGERKLNLFLGGSSGTARTHVTAMEYENPAEPPMFCMLLRKHLIGARVMSVTQPENERIMEMRLHAPGMFGEGEERVLIAELFGRTANIILTDGDGIITDCLYRIGGADEKRAVLPGMRYRLPLPQEKTSLYGVTPDKISELVSGADSSMLFEKWMVATFAGISPVMAREIAFRSCGDVSARVGDMPRSAAEREIEALAEMLRENAMRPYMLSDPEGQPFEYSYMPILQYGPEYALAEKESFSALLEEFWGKRDESERRRQRAGTLLKTVRTQRDRLARKLENQRQELDSAADRERLRENGDIITSNLHTMTKGMSVLRAYDFYSEDGSEREIKLDPLKTPQQNAAKYYKDYTRAKHAEEHLTEQIEKGEKELDYLESVLEELSRAESAGDVEDIRSELSDAGYIRQQKAAKKMRRASSKPMLFRSDSGAEIRVGRNNAQNDELTLRQARRTDVWLHAQKIHGSHVIISCEGAEPDEETVMQAASLAAYYSQGRDGGRMPVDYTMVKYVKKPSGARPGMVIYTDYKTVYAAPDEALAERLRAK